MGLINTKNQSEIDKLELAYIQRVLGRSYNIYLRLLNKDGYDVFIEKLAKYPNSPRNQIKQLIESNEDFGEIEENEKLQLWLNPLKPTISGKIYKFIGLTKEQAEQLHHDIISSIYKIHPDGFDPIYQELKSHFFIITSLIRLHYLKIIYKINNEFDLESPFQHPLFRFCPSLLVQY